MSAVTKLRDVPAQMLATGEIAAAARRLAKSLGNPRQHSVWVRNELGEELFTPIAPNGNEVDLANTTLTDEQITWRPEPRLITPLICVALHPRFGLGVSVPATWEGYAVREEPWG